MSDDLTKPSLGGRLAAPLAAAGVALADMDVLEWPEGGRWCFAVPVSREGVGWSSMRAFAPV